MDPESTRRFPRGAIRTTELLSNARTPRYMGAEVPTPLTPLKTPIRKYDASPLTF